MSFFFSLRFWFCWYIFSALPDYTWRQMIIAHLTEPIMSHVF